MKIPHVHAELIKAWADGAEIELDNYGKWEHIENPMWGIGGKYRIKPEPLIINGVECPKPIKEIMNLPQSRLLVQTQTVQGRAYNSVFYFATDVDLAAVFAALVKPFKD